MYETQIASILSAFDTKLATDPQIRAILRKITGGKATFMDTADYAIRAGNLLGQFLSGEILDISAEDRETLCAALLKNRYTDLNKLLDAVQRAQDKPLGISLNPIKAPFPAERVQQVAHSLLDPGVKPEVIRRRANAPVATVAKSFHDDYIRINAQKRHDLGLKPTIIRYGSNCCAWCSDLAGKYRFGEQPDGIFRRHDNCDCVIIYDTQVLRGAKTDGGGRSKTWVEVDPSDLQTDPPKKMTPEEAESLQNAALELLTLAGERDILRVADSSSIYHTITEESIRNVPLLDAFGNAEKNERYREANRALLLEAAKYKPGVEVTIVYDADMKPLYGFEYRVGRVGGSTISHPGVPFHGFHNHGSNETFSLTDLMGFASTDDMLSVTATGNQGSIYLMKRTESSDSDGYKQFLSDKYTEPFCKIKDTDITVKMTKDEATWDEFYNGLTDSEKEYFRDALTQFGKECAEGGEIYGFQYKYRKA